MAITELQAVRLFVSVFACADEKQRSLDCLGHPLVGYPALATICVAEKIILAPSLLTDYPVFLSLWAPQAPKKA